jgi:hypothetical protein
MQHQTDGVVRDPPTASHGTWRQKQGASG